MMAKEGSYQLEIANYSLDRDHYSSMLVGPTDCQRWWLTTIHDIALVMMQDGQFLYQSHKKLFLTTPVEHMMSAATPAKGVTTNMTM